MAANGIIEVDFYGDATFVGAAGNVEIAIRLGTTKLGIFTLAFGATNGNFWWAKCIIANRNDASVQSGAMASWGKASSVETTATVGKLDTATAWPRTGAIATASDQSLNLRITLGDTGDDVKVEGYTVKVYKKA